MAILTVQDVTRAGVNVTLAAASTNGDTFVNNGRVYLRVKNGSGSSTNVVVTPNVFTDGLPSTSRTVAIAAGVEKYIGPFPADIYNDPATGQMLVTYSSATSMTVAAVRLS